MRVTGAQYHPSPEYTVKLEGAPLAGYQAVMIGGVRDRVIIDRLPKLLPMARRYFDAKILGVFGGRVDPGTVDIDYRLYGAGAVLGPNEPTTPDPAEIGVLITVTAPDQATAHAVSGRGRKRTSSPAVGRSRLIGVLATHGSRRRRRAGCPHGAAVHGEAEPQPLPIGGR